MATGRVSFSVCNKCVYLERVRWYVCGLEFHITWKCSLLSRVWLFVTPWTVAHQAPLSREFSRQEYWRGLPCPTPGDLPNSGIEPGSTTLQAVPLLSEPPGKSMLLTLLIILEACLEEEIFQPSPSYRFTHWADEGGPLETGGVG